MFGKRKSQKKINTDAQKKRQHLDEQLENALNKYEQDKDPQTLYWALKHFHAESVYLLSALYQIQDQTDRATDIRFRIEEVLNESLGVVRVPESESGGSYKSVSLQFPNIEKNGFLSYLSGGITEKFVGAMVGLQRDKEALVSMMADNPNMVLDFARKTFTKKALTEKKKT